MSNVDETGCGGCLILMVILPVFLLMAWIVWDFCLGTMGFCWPDLNLGNC